MQIRGTACSGTLPRLSGCGAVGSVLPWGGRGRRFKSGHSDQRKPTQFRGFFGIAWVFAFLEKMQIDEIRHFPRQYPKKQEHSIHRWRFFLLVFVLGCKMFHQNTDCILIIFTNLFSCIWHPAQGFPSIFITSSNFFDNFPAIQTTIKKEGIFDMILHTERYSVRNDARKRLCNILSGLGMVWRCKKIGKEIARRFIICNPCFSQ